LSVVKNGDRIRLSVRDKRIDLLVDEKEIAIRLATLKPVEAPRRGYAALYQNTVTQAPQGCDFDFLAGL
jgi:dihydroxy-acid dehydratase